MKRIGLTLATMLIIGVSMLPMTAAPTSAGTIYRKEPGGDGYSPCDCYCFWMLGKIFCFCVCTDNPPAQTPEAQ